MLKVGVLDRWWISLFTRPVSYNEDLVNGFGFVAVVSGRPDRDAHQSRIRRLCGSLGG